MLFWELQIQRSNAQARTVETGLLSHLLTAFWCTQNKQKGLVHSTATWRSGGVLEAPGFRTWLVRIPEKEEEDVDLVGGNWHSIRTAGVESRSLRKITLKEIRGYNCRVPVQHCRMVRFIGGSPVLGWRAQVCVLYAWRKFRAFLRLGGWANKIGKVGEFESGRRSCGRVQQT
eukprot:1159583-Pelagomonas_calceolata.AAC.2